MINIGILGTGHMAQKMTHTMQVMRMGGYREFEVSAVASRNMEKAKEFGRRYGISGVYGSYEDMIGDPDIDLVYISTPQSCHYADSCACLRGGKSILCEKPMAVSLKQVMEIFELARKKDLFAAEAMWTRYMPIRQVISDTVWSGKIGMPRFLTASLCYSVAYKERLMDPKLAGGALLEVGVYPLNFSDMVFGGSDLVSAFGLKDHQGLDMQETFTLTHGNGGISVLSSGIISTSARYGSIGCEEGYIRVDNINNPSKVEVYNLNHQLKEIFYAPSQISGLEYEVREAVECIKSRKRETVSMPQEDTIRMMALLDKIRVQLNISYPCE